MCYTYNTHIIHLLEMECKNSMVCFESSKTFISIKFLIQHIKLLHNSFSHNFVCKQNNCNRAFPFLNGLKNTTNNHAKYEINNQQSNTEKQIIKSNSSNPL